MRRTFFLLLSFLALLEPEWMKQGERDCSGAMAEARQKKESQAGKQSRACRVTTARKSEIGTSAAGDFPPPHDNHLLEGKNELLTYIRTASQFGSAANHDLDTQVKSKQRKYTTMQQENEAGRRTIWLKKQDLDVCMRDVFPMKNHHSYFLLFFASLVPCLASFPENSSFFAPG